MNYRLVAIVGLFSCLQVSSLADQDLQTRLENSLRRARALTNVEVQFLESYRSSVDGGNTYFSNVYQYTYIMSGPKYRATCKVISSSLTDTTKLSETAFNKKSFVTYNGDTHIMTRRREIDPRSNSELAVNPLIAPFLFLSPNSDTCAACLLRFRDIVSRDFAKGLTFPKAQDANGALHVVMPGLRLGKKPTSWTLSFDKSGNFFTPNSATLLVEAGSEIMYTFLNYTNLGGYEFPGTVRFSATTYPSTSPPTVTSSGTMSVIYARLPESIPDSTFELDEESAKAVWDRDQQRLTKMAPKVASKLSEPNVKRRVVVVALLALAILVPLWAFTKVILRRVA